jgi:hypothetical protein
VQTELFLDGIIKRGCSGRTDERRAVMRIYTHSSSEKEEPWGWMITVYRKKLESTHGGNCIVRECKAVMAWSGLGEVVDTASMTEGGVNVG